MPQEKYDIFISYRRVGGADKARILKTELEGRGYKVFLDFDELKDGVFDKRIMDAIDSSPIFMFLLTPNSLERCLNEDDWVRREIEYAVDNRKHFIPINPDCTFRSLPEGLSPKVMEGLGQHQFSDVMFGQLFKASINKLIEDRICPILAGHTISSIKGAIVRIDTDLDCRVLLYGEEIGIAKSGEYTKMTLPLGDNMLKFVGFESDADCDEQFIAIDDERQKLIKVKLLGKYNARKAREEAERKEKEQECLVKIEAERMAKEEAARKAEQERLAKIEAERRAKEKVERKAEQERLAKIEAERMAKEKAVRDAYLKNLPDEEFECFMSGWKLGFRLKSTGEVVVNLKYDEMPTITSKSYFYLGLARVKLKGKYGFIDKTGKEVIPLKYDDADDFSEGLAVVKLNGKWGYIDKTGKEVIPFKYDWGGSFIEGLALVKLNGKYGFIDKTGKEVISFKYDVAWSFREGLALVELKGKRGFIDKTGKEVIPLKYHFAQNFKDGKAKVYTKNIFGIEKEFYIDKNGNRVEE